MTFSRILCVISILVTTFAVRAADAPVAAPTTAESDIPDTTVPNWEQAEKDATALKPASGLKLNVFAAEPQSISPVCLDVDYKGRVWLVETFRITPGGNTGVYDIRNIYDRLDEDLAAHSVEERLAMVKRWEHNDLSIMTREADRIHLIEDRDGDGRADHVKILAQFRDAMDGVAAGVLVHGDDIYFADVPNLWLLKQQNGDGVIHDKTSLSYGYAVRYALSGHDLHGLRIGPDGKLYFSMGDRGLNVKTKEGKSIVVTESGCVLRCDLDGSNLELFHTGLRNPQELAFDQYGDLFTGDNNCDYGDPGRWVYLVEGGDTGWRIGYQHIQFPRSTGPWFNEMLWAKEAPGNAAYLLPPIDHISTGPSGCCYYYGVGLPEKFKEHFFLCDFRAGSASVIHSFKLKPKGASFEVVRDKQMFLEHANATDIEFGPDGAAYVCDWMVGFTRKPQGRIYRVTGKEEAGTPIVLETKRLLGEGMKSRTETELVTLLSHVDMRVRMEAQFELVRRGESSIALLQQTAASDSNQLARLHAIWGLGMIARTNPNALKPVIDLVTDPDEQVKSQAIKVLGDAKIEPAYTPILSALKDKSARVKFFAAMALGKFHRPESIAPIIAMLAESADKDAYLRHAGVMGLVGSANGDVLMQAAKDPSAAARMAVCLALRKEGDPKIAAFLDDADPLIVLEAARAINDAPISEAMPQLAKVIERQKLSVPLAHRALNANFRVGAAENARAVASFAERKDGPELMRVEALNMLKMWAKPPGKDRVLGTWRPLPERDGAIATSEIKRVVPKVMMTAPAQVRITAIDLIKDIPMDDHELLYKLVTSKDVAPEVAAAALAAMAEQKDPKLAEATELSLKSNAPAIRAVAIKQLARRPDAAPRLEAMLKTGSVSDQQAVLAALAKMKGNGDAERIISQHMDALLAGSEPDPIQLDTLEAAESHKSEGLKEKLAQYSKSKPKGDVAASHHEELFGGDAEAGRKIFFDRTDVACLRCHKIGDQGGGIVGPNLSGVGARNDRAYLLESVLDPNKKIAAGFEAVAIKMKNGTGYNGVVKSETDNEIVLDTADASGIKIAKADVVSRDKGLSPMPQDVAKPLNKRDLRNLIEFLANQKQSATTQQAAK
ncbi:MAG TPA: PVC-type heme-binding CxxCH protein [Tepidisphaeraceae bacterium]|nr:PVC-type heme-binding CxxCH protein [Tepidisphaeraceae bacterium]